jgi:tetratricopeptide (TPR) repeat protein
LKEARLDLYLQTYLTLANPADSFRVSREILAADPDSGLGLYWCTVILPELPGVAPDALDAGEKAARQLLERVNVYFKPDNKPASVDAAQWQKKAAVTEALAHRSLGWASWQRGNLAAAEDEFTKSLTKNPDNAQVSAWLGIVLSLENGKQVPALWQLAQASNPASAGMISEEQRRQVNGVLEHVYASYHGSLDGLDDLKKASATKAFPDPAFTIDSATMVAARHAEEELSLTNPELAAWLSIRRQLTAADG